MTEIKIKSIFKLIGLNYTNFFIMGHLETIQYVLGTVRLSRNNRYRQLSFLVFATILYFFFFFTGNIPSDRFTSRYKWFGLTQDLGNLSCCCGTFNVILIRPNYFLKSGFIEDMVRFPYCLIFFPYFNIAIPFYRI